MEDLAQFIQAEIATIAFKKVSLDDALITSKLLDSIIIVELLIAIEEKIGKPIPQHLIKDENFDSINKIIKTIEKI